MSFLDGRYIPRFDVTKELPSKGTLEYQMYTHDINNPSVCDLNENRYSIPNFYDSEDQKTYKQLYCWKGIIRENPGCTVGSVCDPHSYSGARTRFCLTWGCPDPHLYVADDKGQPVVNERGGIIVYTNKGDCKGSFISQMKCFMNGIRQSADHILDPENRRSLMMQMIMMSIVLSVAIIVLVKFRKSKNKRIAKFRKSISPHFAKTRPLFPKSR